MTNSGMQEAVIQSMQGDDARELGDFASAASHYAEAADLFRKLGDDTGLALALTNQGFVAQKLGDDEGAAGIRDLQAELTRQLEGQN